MGEANIVNIEPLSAVVGSLPGIVAAVGALVYARGQWKASNRDDSKQERQERMDHQGCLEMLQTHIKESAERFSEYDDKFLAISLQHQECTQSVSKLTAENETMRDEIRKIRKTISPQPFQKVTP
jgi:septal ring factor EnvC (AmiA/AmiB activator)